MNGIIVVNKPKNHTSFDVIAILRKKLGQKKIGHMGTLDPMATGVLPILLGSTAKFQIFTEENEKEYIAEIIFGLTTTTWDIFGEETERKEANISKENLAEILPKFTGEIMQVPPMFSAIKKNGVKLCDLARKGKEIEREARKVEIKNLEILDFNEEKQTAKLKILCSKGTYIRSLCHEIGVALGTGACMGELTRTLSNSFRLEESTALEKIKNMELNEIIENLVLPTDRLFKSNRSVCVSEDQARMFRNGIALKTELLNISEEFKNDEIIKIYEDKKFIGLGKFDSSEKVIRYLKAEN